MQISQLVGERVPDADQLFDFHQSFTLASRGRTVDGPGDLEVTFLTNAVGSEVFVRPASPWARYWDDKAPARRFIVAHRNVNRVDWLTEIRRWINEVALPAR
jgi:sporulation-control protein